MIHELNGSVFSKDPIHRVYDPMCPIDVQNTNYVMELKNREKYNPQDFDGSLIEKINDYLVNNANGKIPVMYVSLEMVHIGPGILVR